jgi:reverse transcriptase-like protein
MFLNYKHKYKSRGKYIFVPTERCDRKGQYLINYFSKRGELPDYFYHYRPGGHVAALYKHLECEFFFKIDIQNFFYSIARNRVTRALRSWGLRGAESYAKWSCVSSPYPAGPRYVLPIGFKQSPLLASLVLMQSPVAEAIERANAKGVFVSVYLDDFVGAHDDEELLTEIYEDIRSACVASNLLPNAGKLVPPNRAIVAFNCNLSKGSAQVTPERIAQFYQVPRTPRALQSFGEYVERVRKANAQAAPP